MTIIFKTNQPVRLMAHIFQVVEKYSGNTLRVPSFHLEPIAGGLSLQVDSALGYKISEGLTNWSPEVFN